MTHLKKGSGRAFFTVTLTALCVFATLPARAGQVVRLTPSAQFDLSFNGTGVVSFSQISVAYSALVQPGSGGKVLIGGRFNGSDGQYGFVSRYNADGSPDTGFGFAGVTLADFAAANKKVFSIGVQSSLQIIAGGISIASSGAKAFLLWRFNTDGSPDTRFGSGGTSRAFSFSNGELERIRILPDDSIVAVGHDDHNRILIAKFTSNGALDSTFAGAGQLTIGSFTGSAHGVDYDGDKIIVVGTNNQAPRNKMFALRLTSRGALDGTFDGDGIMPIVFPGSLATGASQVRCWPQNGCFIAGSAHDSQARTDSFAIVHLTPGGAIDTTFGYKVDTFGINWSSVGASNIAITSDKKFFVSGLATDGQSNAWATAEYTFAGALVPSFSGGKSIVTMSNPENILIDSAGMALDQATGNVIVCN